MADYASDSVLERSPPRTVNPNANPRNEASLNDAADKIGPTENTLTRNPMHLTKLASVRNPG